MNEINTRERILLAAGPIFAFKGYRGATIREICEAADVNLASVNYYFGDKQKLYNEAVIKAREMRIQQVPSPEWDDDTPAEEKLNDFIRLILSRLVALETEPWQVRLFMREMLHPTQASKNLIEEYTRPFLAIMLTIVDDIVGFRLPDHKRTQIGFSIIGQCLYYRFMADLTAVLVDEQELKQHFSREQLAEHITQFSLTALNSIRSGQVSIVD